MLAPQDPYNLVECAVCCVPFDAHTPQSMVAQCKHRFHAECLDTWQDTCIEAYKDPTCPLCNGPLFNDYSTVVWRPGIERVIIIEAEQTGVMHFRNADGSVRKASVPASIDVLTDNIVDFLSPPGPQLSRIVFERKSLERSSTLHFCIVRVSNRLAVENAVRVYTCERYTTQRQQAALCAKLEQDASRASFLVHANNTSFAVEKFVRRSYGRA